MKRVFFISFFIIFFLIIFSNSASAQVCNCVRRPSGTLGEYQCIAENTYCSNGGFCQCEPLQSTDRNAVCSQGTCLTPSPCESLPSTYCIDQCRFPKQGYSCPSNLVCCSITAADRDPNCVNNCNTQCVFGNNLSGFTCKIENGPHGTQTCACYPPSQQPTGGTYDICQGNADCLSCVTAGNAWTALGCITTSDPQAFITWLLGAAIGLAGGIAVLLIIFGGFLIILSSGDPQRLQAGKDILTSAIIGLVVIIFAVFLLRIIGVEILKIPGFE
ncbi:MAG: pilin [Candidatus Marinimicrobia bacterium]|nr:pilin [Candidatus Neomarinimicrobiota bacterium]